MIDIFALFLSDSGAWLVAAALLFALCVLLHRWRMAYLQRRVGDLQLAAKALYDHSQAALVILDDPAPSDVMKRSLCSFSEVVTEREFARSLVSSFLDGSFDNRKLSASERRLQEERAELAGAHQHLARAFDRVSQAGMIALLLRWPETANIFSSVAYEMAADDRNEIKIEVKASSFLKKRNRNCDDDHGSPMGPMLAPV